MLKELNINKVMKNQNVQCKVDNYQYDEKVEDQCPHVCISIQEDVLIVCLVVSPGRWSYCDDPINVRFCTSCCCLWS